MNSRCLTLEAIEGKAERVPFNPFIMHLAASLYSIDYSGVYCQDARVLADAQIKCAKAFGIDHVNVSTDAYREANAWGVEIDFSSHTPVAKKHLGVEDFAQVEEPDLNASQRVQDRVEAVRSLREGSNDQCVIGWIEAPFAEICCLFGMMNVLKLARRDDWNELVQGLLDRVISIQLEFAMMQVEAGADIIGAGDSAVSQIGPKRYEEACLESTQNLFKAINKHAPVLYHVCGDCSVVDTEGRDMLELVASSGASVLDIDYQVDLASAKAKIGSRVCLRGNTNTSLLGNETYTEIQVAKEISEAIQAGKPGGRYMFSAGCEWPWEPLELATRNLQIARNVVEELGGY
ncbi:MAG: uroporphyrinogen decarboxylase family protein [Candidatus Thorarchaeota archaeon]